MKVVVGFLLFMLAINSHAATVINSQKEIAKACDSSGTFVSSWLAGEHGAVKYIAIWVITSKTQAKICIAETTSKIGRVVASKMIPVSKNMTFTSGTCTHSEKQTPFVFALTSDGNSGDDVDVIKAWMFDIGKMSFRELPNSSVKCVAS